MRQTLTALALGFSLPCASLLCNSVIEAQSAAPAGWSAQQEGANWIYKPDGLPAGQVFVETIGPVESLNGQSLAGWFAAKAEADLARRGTKTGPSNPQKSANGSLVMAASYRDSNGRSWSALYAGAEVPGGAQFCSMITNVPPGMMNPYIQKGAYAFGLAVKQMRAGQSAAVRPLVSGDAGDRGNGRATTETSHTEAAQTTQPVTGVRGTEIAAMLHEGRGMTTATGYQYVESVDLLLKDGWEYSGLTIPPEDLDVVASKKTEPQHWHHWKQEGGHFLIEENGRWQAVEADVARPLASGSQLSMRLIYRHATVFIGMGSHINTQRIRFDPSGRFVRSSDTLAGSGAMQTSNGFSGGGASHTDQFGRSSSASGTYSGASGSVTARSTHSQAGGEGAATGTYKVSGYSLELDCANGRVERLLAFYPFAGKPDVYIEKETYNVDR